MRQFRIRIRYDVRGYFMTKYVSGHSLDEAKDEAIRWINGNPSILKAQFEVVSNG